MPRYRKKRYKKRKQSSTVVSLRSQPFPDSFITKHRYVVSETIDASIGNPTAHYYNCIGLFDPESAVGGHQPLGFDQMIPIYDHYNVLGARITVTGVCTGTIGDSVILGVFINDDTGAVTTTDTIQEQGKGKSVVLSAVSGQTKKMYHNFSTKKFFGVVDVMDNDRLRGTSIANPADGAYFTVYAQALNPGSNPVATNVNIQIDYIVKWSERRSLAQS